MRISRSTATSRSPPRTTIIARLKVEEEADVEASGVVVTSAGRVKMGWSTSAESQASGDLCDDDEAMMGLTGRRYGWRLGESALQNEPRLRDRPRSCLELVVKCATGMGSSQQEMSLQVERSSGDAKMPLELTYERCRSSCVCARQAPSLHTPNWRHIFTGGNAEDPTRSSLSGTSLGMRRCYCGVHSDGAWHGCAPRWVRGRHACGMLARKVPGRRSIYVLWRQLSRPLVHVVFSLSRTVTNNLWGVDPGLARSGGAAVHLASGDYDDRATRHGRSPVQGPLTATALTG